jgi:hypothetical protein
VSMSDSPQRTPAVSTDITDRMADLFEAREQRWLTFEHPQNARCVALSFAVTASNSDFWRSKNADKEATDDEKTQGILKRADAFLEWLNAVE